MKRLLFLLVVATTMCHARPKASAPQLRFDAVGEHRELDLPRGEVVGFTAYERLYYVTNVEDSAYQYLNIYVPDGATEDSPIFLRTYVGGYMAAAAKAPQSDDASGRALLEGYVVVIPGTRGRNSTVTVDKRGRPVAATRKGSRTTYTGRAPAAILDLKAAIRYLRQFDDKIAGNTERIVTDGTSAGGAMSALMGGTGNHPDYAEALRVMGAADQRDDVFASVCFCPITDLDHADMAYEWLYGQTTSRRSMDDASRTASKELASQFETYVDSLDLAMPDGTPLTAVNYANYIRQLLIASAQRAKDAGADIADTIGISINRGAGLGGMPPVNGGVGMPRRIKAGPNFRGGFPQGDYVVDVDIDKYLEYVASTIALKGVPAFDAFDLTSGENEEFGDANGTAVHFTPYSSAKSGQQQNVSADVARNVRLMNPMYYIGDTLTSVAPHWYIRHGARDRDTAFPVPINLSLLLEKNGADVNFCLPWNRGHSGDYALDELFTWLDSIM